MTSPSASESLTIARRGRIWSLALLTAAAVAAAVPATLIGQPETSAARPSPASPRAAAPVDLTGYWVSVVTEDWAWRMRTPPKGDYASVPLNEAGTRVADRWTEDEDGSCLAFGAPAVLRMPTRVHVSWQDDSTLKLETDNGMQTRLLHFDAPAPRPSTGHSLQGYSRAAWQTAAAGRSSGADGGISGGRGRANWGSLEVETTNLRAAWLRPNGVPYSAEAKLTEYFDAYADGDDDWFTVTTIVEDPAYLTEPFVISSNFKREPDGGKWRPKACR